MGLFSAVLHVRHESDSAAITALIEYLAARGFRLDLSQPVPPSGPEAVLPERTTDGAHYLVSKSGPWLTIIEAQFCSDVPLASVGTALSQALSCYALTLNVHDDDLFLYDLDKNGSSLDGYNSCPQYFENDRLAEDFIESQRHTPESFLPLLPDPAVLPALQSLLARGWWSAHDSGRLDEDGVVVDDESDDSYMFEGERMTEFGNLLHLHPGIGDYPYAAWRSEVSSIEWDQFTSIKFLPQHS